MNSRSMKKNMIKRIDQQLLVNKLMLENVDLDQIQGRNKRRYMIHYLNIVTTISSVILFKTGTEDALERKQDLWKSIKEYDQNTYFRMRRSLLGSIINMPGSAGRKLSLFAYKKAQQKIGFN